MDKLIGILRRHVLTITFITTLLLCILYFAYLQSYNSKWINNYVKVVYLLPILAVYFFGFSGIFFLKKYTQLKFKAVFKHLSIILLPLVVCFAVMISYGFCLTVFNFQSIFLSIMNLCQYSYIILVIIVYPSIIFICTYSIINLIKPAVIEDAY